MPRPIDKSMEIRDALRKHEEEVVDQLERIALAYVLDSVNARLKDVDERVRELEKSL